MLGPWSLAAVKARERLARATSAAQELRTYVKESTSPHSVHLAWSIATRSIAQALTYDCRLVPPEALAPIAQQLDDLVEGLLEDLAGTPIDNSHWRQLSLPGPLSGCGVVSTVQLASAAYASTWLQLRERLQQLTAAFQRPANLDNQGAEAAKAVAALQRKGSRLQIH